MEAIVFGFLAYFGSEIGEYAHEQYNQHIHCRIEICEELAKTSQTITIEIKQNDKIVSETHIGADNE